MDETTITIVETKKEDKPDIPNSNYIGRMIKEINQCLDIHARVQMIIDLFTYLIRYKEFISNHKEFSYVLRDRVKIAEEIANESFENGEIDFETATNLVSLSNQLLEITQHVADFDCGDASRIIPCKNFSHNNNNNGDFEEDEGECEGYYKQEEKDFFGFEGECEEDEGECEGYYKQEEKDFFGFEGEYKQEEEEYEGYYDY